jgi:hypothetical protein
MGGFESGFERCNRNEFWGSSVRCVENCGDGDLAVIVDSFGKSLCRDCNSKIKTGERDKIAAILQRLREVLEQFRQSSDLSLFMDEKEQLANLRQFKLACKKIVGSRSSNKLAAYVADEAARRLCNAQESRANNALLNPQQVTHHLLSSCIDKYMKSRIEPALKVIRQKRRESQDILYMRVARAFEQVCLNEIIPKFLNNSKVSRNKRKSVGIQDVLDMVLNSKE